MAGSSDRATGRAGPIRDGQPGGRWRACSAGSAPAVSGLVLASVFDWIADLARSDWVYLIVPALIVVDAFVGILPAETVLHAAGVGAAQGDISLVVVLAEATLAAVLADVLLYAVGAKGSQRIRGLLVRGEKSKRRYKRICCHLHERSWLLTVARFVPGLRAFTMLAAGTTRMARSRFLAFEVPGAALWASYNVMLGYVLGQIFKNSGFWVPLVVSAAIAGGLTLVFELVRRARSHAQPAGAG